MAHFRSVEIEVTTEGGEVIAHVRATLATGAEADASEVHLDMARSCFTIHQVRCSISSSIRQSGRLIVLTRSDSVQGWDGAIVSYQVLLGEVDASGHSRIVPAFFPDGLPSIVCQPTEQLLPVVTVVIDELLKDILLAPILREPWHTGAQREFLSCVVIGDSELDEVSKGLFVSSGADLGASGQHKVAEFARRLGALTQMRPAPRLVLMSPNDVGSCYLEASAVILDRGLLGDEAVPDNLTGASQLALEMSGVWFGSGIHIFGPDRDVLEWGIHAGLQLYLLADGGEAFGRLLEGLARIERPGVGRFFSSRKRALAQAASVAIRIAPFLDTEQGQLDFRRMLREAWGGRVSQWLILEGFRGAGLQELKWSRRESIG